MQIGEILGVLGGPRRLPAISATFAKLLWNWLVRMSEFVQMVKFHRKL